MPRKRVSPPIVPPKTPAPEPENKRTKFLRLVEPRVQRALNSIRLIGNLSTPNYEYHEDDLAKIQTAIVDELGAAISRFEKRKKRTADFHLEEQF